MKVKHHKQRDKNDDQITLAYIGIFCSAYDLVVMLRVIDILPIQQTCSLHIFKVLNGYLKLYSNKRKQNIIGKGSYSPSCKKSKS